MEIDTSKVQDEINQNRIECQTYKVKVTIESTVQILPLPQIRLSKYQES